MFEKLYYLDKKIRVCKINAVTRFLRTIPKVIRILMQNFQHRVSREQVVVQTNHLKPPSRTSYRGSHDEI